MTLPGIRLHHLDALRSFAILYGVLVHSATLGVGWPLSLVSEISGYFRMGTFFLVSGFFGAMGLQRAGTAGFLQKRAVALLVPLICGVLLLNPVTNWLIWNWHNPHMDFAQFTARMASDDLPPYRGPLNWHLHLWFLLSLSFYAMMAPAVMGAVRRLSRLAKGLGDRLATLPGWLCVIAVATLVALTSLGLRIFYEIALEPLLPRGGSTLWLVFNTLYYWPMFLTGMAVFHHKGLAARFQYLSLPALALGLTAVLAVREIMPPSGLMWEGAQLLSRAFLTVAAIASLMAIFARWFSKPGFLSRSADAVYSIYILHFMVIYLIAHALHRLGLSQVPQFIVVAGLTVPVLFLLHRFVIRPSPLLSLMLNGKPFASRQKHARAET